MDTTSNLLYPFGLSWVEYVERHLLGPSGLRDSTGKPKQKWSCPFGNCDGFEQTRGSRKASFDSGSLCRCAPGLTESNSLANAYPELAAAVHSVNPLGIAIGSVKKIQWRCPVGHIFSCKPNTVVSRGRVGCPICSNKLVQPGVNDLATTHPEYAAIVADPLDTTRYSAGSHKKINFICSKGHPFSAVLRDVVLGGHGCGVCTGDQLLVGVNDIATTHPHLIHVFADPEDATKYTAGSGKKVDFICPRGHVSSRHIASKILDGKGCGICSGKVFAPGVNDIATTHPEWVPNFVDPEIPFAFSAHAKKRVRFVCEEGHITDSPINARLIDGLVCGTCYGRQFRPGVNDVATTHPKSASWFVNKRDAHQNTAASRKVTSFKCAEGHIYSTSIYNRVVLGQDCRVCALRVCVQGVNDVATTHPGLVHEFVDQSLAQSVTSISARLVMFRCPKKGHLYESSPRDRIVRRRACSVCTPGGYSPKREGFIYMVSGIIAGEFILKVGISNTPERRLREHANQKLTEVAWVLGWPDGSVAQNLERLWKSEFMPAFSDGALVTKASLRDGHTEAVVVSGYDHPLVAEFSRRALAQSRCAQGFVHSSKN